MAASHDVRRAAEASLGLVWHSTPMNAADVSTASAPRRRHRDRRHRPARRPLDHPPDRLGAGRRDRPPRRHTARAPCPGRRPDSASTTSCRCSGIAYLATGGRPVAPPARPRPVAAGRRRRAGDRRRDRQQHLVNATSPAQAVTMLLRSPGRYVFLAVIVALVALAEPADRRGLLTARAMALLGTRRGGLRAGRVLPAARRDRPRADAQVLGPLLRGAGPDRRARSGSHRTSSGRSSC